MGDEEIDEVRADSPSENTGEKPACMVCYNNFHSKSRVPRILSCGHSFCQECIQSLIANSPPFIRGLACPTCRKTYPFDDPYRPLESIPTNYVLREMLEKQEENEKSRLGDRYGCRHCRKEFHEKDLIRCETCSPAIVHTDSKDFMGRPNLLLICSDCMRVHHTGHSFLRQSAVAGRWKHRNLFQKFEKTVQAEDARMARFIETMTTAINTAQTFRNNLLETVSQIGKEAGHHDISSVLRNFLKASTSSAKFVDMSTECVDCFTKPTAPQNSMLGKDLFRFGRSNHDEQEPVEYGKLLADLFNKANSSTVTPAEGSMPGPSNTAGNVPVNPVPPVPYGQNPDVLNARPVGLAFQPVNMNGLMNQEPALQLPFNQVYNAVLHYQQQQQQQQHQHQQNHHHQQLQEQHLLQQQIQQQLAQQLQLRHHQQHQQMINLNALFELEIGQQVRRQVVHAFQNEQHVPQQVPVPPPEEGQRIQNYFQLPFHVFNAQLPLLYQETLGGMVRLFVNNVPVNEGWQEVNDYFFTPPYENRNFTPQARLQIAIVLTNMMDILVRGQMPHTAFAQMRAALEAVNEEDPEVVWLGDDDDNEVEHAEVPVILPVLVDAGLNEEELQLEGDGHELIGVAEEIVQEQHVAELELFANERNEQEPNNNDLQQEELGPDDEQNEHAPQQEPDEEGILQLQRQARENFVFQIEDLLIEPPARATRGAKRRADALHPPAQQDVPHDEPGTSSSSHSDSQRRVNSQKRNRK